MERNFKGQVFRQQCKAPDINSVSTNCMRKKSTQSKKYHSHHVSAPQIKESYNSYIGKTRTSKVSK